MSKQYDDSNRGVLFKNEKKQHENQPDYTGNINVGGTDFWLSAWVKTAQSGRKYMSVSVTAKEDQQPTGKTHGEMKKAARQSFDDMDSDIPF